MLSLPFPFAGPPPPGRLTNRRVDRRRRQPGCLRHLQYYTEYMGKVRLHSG